MTLPTTAKLTLHTIEEKLYQPLEWVPIVDLPTGDGLVSPFSPTRVWSASQPPSPTAAPVPRAPLTLPVSGVSSRWLCCRPSPLPAGLTFEDGRLPQVYMTALAVESANKNFLEACYHLFTPHDQAFPGTVLSTGTEDYFDSACKLHDHEPDLAFAFPNNQT